MLSPKMKPDTDMGLTSALPFGLWVDLRPGQDISGCPTVRDKSTMDLSDWTGDFYFQAVNFSYSKRTADRTADSYFQEAVKVLDSKQKPPYSFYVRSTFPCSDFDLSDTLAQKILPRSGAP